MDGQCHPSASFARPCHGTAAIAACPTSCRMRARPTTMVSRGCADVCRKGSVQRKGAPETDTAACGVSGTMAAEHAAFVAARCLLLVSQCISCRPLSPCPGYVLAGKFWGGCARSAGHHQPFKGRACHACVHGSLHAGSRGRARSQLSCLTAATTLCLFLQRWQCTRRAPTSCTSLGASWTSRAWERSWPKSTGCACDTPLPRRAACAADVAGSAACSLRSCDCAAQQGMPPAQAPGNGEAFLDLVKRLTGAPLGSAAWVKELQVGWGWTGGCGLGQGWRRVSRSSMHMTSLCSAVLLTACCALRACCQA